MADRRRNNNNNSSSRQPSRSQGMNNNYYPNQYEPFENFEGEWAPPADTNSSYSPFGEEGEEEYQQQQQQQQEEEEQDDDRYVARPNHRDLPPVRTERANVGLGIFMPRQPTANQQQQQHTGYTPPMTSTRPAAGSHPVGGRGVVSGGGSLQHRPQRDYNSSKYNSFNTKYNDNVDNGIPSRSNSQYRPYRAREDSNNNNNNNNNYSGSYNNYSSANNNYSSANNSYSNNYNTNNSNNNYSSANNTYNSANNNNYSSANNSYSSANNNNNNNYNDNNNNYRSAGLPSDGYTSRPDSSRGTNRPPPPTNPRSAAPSRGGSTAGSNRPLPPVNPSSRGVPSRGGSSTAGSNKPLPPINPSSGGAPSRGYSTAGGSNRAPAPVNPSGSRGVPSRAGSSSTTAAGGISNRGLAPPPPAANPRSATAPSRGSSRASSNTSVRNALGAVGRGLKRAATVTVEEFQKAEALRKKQRDERNRQKAAEQAEALRRATRRPAAIFEIPDHWVKTGYDADQGEHYYQDPHTGKAHTMYRR